MPVDKFGRDNSNQINPISGVSIHYINNNFLRRDGTNTAVGPLNMASNRISKVINPIDGQDVATKTYVDNSGADKVDKAGDTMTGPLDMSKNRITNVPFKPTDTNDAVSAAFVIQEQINIESKTLSTDGGKAMTGHLNMNHHFINDVLDPAYDQDAATKSYVDKIVTSFHKFGSSSSGHNVPEKVTVDRHGLTITDGGSLGIGIPAGGTDIEIVQSNTNTARHLPGGIRIRNADSSSHLQLGWDTDGFTINVVDGSTIHKIMTINDGRMTCLTNPTHDSDAATKGYVEEVVKRSYDRMFGGVIPQMSQNDMTNINGFKISTSSAYDERYAGWRAFSIGNGEWATRHQNVNFWIMVECPFPFQLLKFSIRGRLGNVATPSTPSDWEIQCSNDARTWISAYSSKESVPPDRDMEVTLKQPLSNVYRLYRVYARSGTGVHPGLSRLQLFTI